MCGIVGCAGKLEMKHMLAFRDMLTVNQLRGRDSTGVVRVNSYSGYKWQKRVGPPEFLLETKFYDKEIETVGAKALIGHGRAKTVGEASLANAHPFEFSDLIGVHNGTLRSYYTKERARDFDVDSEWLYWHINEYGLKETISQLDNEGAWALVYWNNKEKTLNFLRNDKRPLWFAHTKDQKVMFWASEAWFFHAAMRRGIEFHEDDKGKRFYELPIETHLSFTIDAAKDKPSEIFTLKVENDVKGEVRGYSGNYQTAWNSHGSGGAYGNNSGGSVTSPFVKKEELDDDISDIANVYPLLPKPTSQTQGGATHTHSTDGKSSNSSPKTTDSKTGSSVLNGSARPKLSLPSSTSKSSQQGSSESSVKSCSESLVNCEKPKTDLRTCAGMQFITDNKSGTEFGEHRFDQLTGGVCCFCKAPIGSLTEVSEIFVKQEGGRFELPTVTFICTTCTDPNPVISYAGAQLLSAAV